MYDIQTLEHHAKCHSNSECRMRFDPLVKWQVDMLSLARVLDTNEELQLRICNYRPVLMWFVVGIYIAYLVW